MKFVQHLPPFNTAFTMYAIKQTVDSEMLASDVMRAHGFTFFCIICLCDVTFIGGMQFFIS